MHLHPVEEEFFFYPKDPAFKEEYETLIPLTEIFNLYKNGIQSGDDNFSISMSPSDLGERMQKFYSKNLSHDEVRTMFDLTDKAGWDFKDQRNSALKEGYDSNLIKPYLYRPFDERWIFFSKRALKRPVIEVMQHMLQENLALITCKQQYELGFRHVFVSKLLGDCNAISIESREFSHYFPLYKYPETRHTRVKKGKIVEDNTEQTNLFTVTHNFSNGFVVTISNKLGYIPTPEAIFHYIYAIFHSPTYRQRYAEFLQIGFPRVPLTSNDQLFKDLGAKGQALVDLHLMKSKKLNKLIPKMGGDGDNAVTEVTYKSVEQRVYINKNQYFEGISPEVWEFKIGGYQVLDKWLKDRKKAKRTLSFDDVLHYRKVVVALKETMQLMVEIDQLIPSFPIE